MNASAVEPDRLASGAPAVDLTALSGVFHRLNNQLGIILANAELLEARLSEDALRARASQVVSGALEAISTVQDLRRHVGGRFSVER
jgi:hypothetical protein